MGGRRSSATRPDPLGALRLYPGPLTEKERDLIRCAIRAGLITREYALGLLRAQYVLEPNYRYVDDLLSPQTKQDLGLPAQNPNRPKRFQLIPQPVDLKNPGGPASPPLPLRPQDPMSVPSIAATAKEIEGLFNAYEAEVAAEWVQVKKLKVLFNELEAQGPARGHPDPEEYWRFLRTLYFRYGFPKPLNTIRALLSRTATIAGKKVGGGMSQKFQATIKAADAWLSDPSRKAKRDEVATNVTRLWAWSPRPLNDSQIGLHAIGDAMDIDSKDNPHIKADGAIALDKFLDWRASTGAYTEKYRFRSPVFTLPNNASLDPLIAAREFFTGMKSLSEAMKDFLTEWLDKAQTIRDRASKAAKKLKELEKQNTKKPGSVTAADLTAAKNEKTAADKDLSDHKEELTWTSKVVIALGGDSSAKRVRDRGLLTIPLALFEAFAIVSDIDAPVRFGIQYQKAKDVMHIEILATYPKDPCLQELKRRGFPVG